jgi:hypothetical protein
MKRNSHAFKRLLIKEYGLSKAASTRSFCADQNHGLHKGAVKITKPWILTEV